MPFEENYSEEKKKKKDENENNDLVGKNPKLGL